MEEHGTSSALERQEILDSSFPQQMTPSQTAVVPEQERTRFRNVAVGFQQVEQEYERPQAPTLGRRAREREARRREILQVSRSLFAGQGFTGTTIDEIARLTEFAKPTIYQYFKSKEEIFYTILQEGYQDLNGILSKALQARASVAQQFRTVCVMFLIYYRKQMDFYLIQRQFASRLQKEQDDKLHASTRRLHLQLITGVESLLNQGVRRGEFRNVDCHTLTMLFFETLNVYTTAFRDGGELRTANELADEILAFFMYGIEQRA